MSNEQHICIICGRAFVGWGNNAQPITEGRCCDDCNREIVVPTRVALVLKHDKEGEKRG